MNSNDEQACVVTGSTSGIGLATAHELTQYGTLILVGRNTGKLKSVGKDLENSGRRAICVQCDISEPESIRAAVGKIIDTNLKITGLVNCAGIFPLQAAPKNSQGWDKTFATNHVGPFIFTESLLPSMPDGANVVFVVSGVEDEERKPATAAGFRGGRYISIEACSRGEWRAGGSKNPGFDAYATSKQCNLAAAIEFARENPRLYINAVEPGFSPGTNLGRDAHSALLLISKLMSVVAPYIKYWSTPKIAARVISKVLRNDAKQTSVYFDDEGSPMKASKTICSPEFTANVVAETRALVSRAKTPV